ncbi:sensor histidine kinase [Brevibacterium album]|uniref:sensor histidine kinase n=1 Tax=Brevibacterium album TaxID=417948 RepID=UPI000410DBDB|nr:sensor histidine kinase [Brevibacterium album]
MVNRTHPAAPHDRNLSRPGPVGTLRPGRHPIWSLRELGRDCAYVLAGFPLSLFAFALLIPLFAMSVGTAVIWVGVLLLPVTLMLASGFAALSRVRLRAWGLPLAPAQHPVRPSSVMGLVRRIGEPRRWLDLVFETLVAFPLRTVTFAVGVAWLTGALAGVTFPLWGIFVPRSDGTLPGLILDALTDGAAPASLTRSYLLDAAFNFSAGVILLATLAPVMRGLACADAAITRAALGALPDELLAAGMPTTPQTPGVPHDPAGPRTAHPGPAVLSAGPVSPESRPSPSSHPQPCPQAPTSAPTSAPGVLSRSISARGWAWLGAGFAAAVLLAVNWPVTAAAYGVPAVFAMLTAAGHSTGLALAAARPYAAVVLTAASAAATALLTAHTTGLPWPWPVPGLLAAAGTVLVLALTGPWHRALTGWILSQAAVLAALALAALVSGSPFSPGLTPGALSSLVTAASVTAAAGLLGAGVRALAESRGALAAERRTSADLTAKQRELAERNRIAQELHDVVAHSMSVISVQATTAPYRLQGTGPEEQAEFASIADSSRRALTEMRGLLALLRATDAEAPLAPQPGLADVPALVEATRASGTEITLSAGAGGTTDPGGLAAPAATGLTAYRIVQEALSNAVRHAPGAPVSVTLAADPESVTVDVVNGSGAPDAERRLTAAPGAGLGLRGIRERAQALGGIVEAGPAPDGGFRVHAVLPLG